MKRLLSFITLLLLTAVVGGLMVHAALPAAGAEETTVVVHFHKWDDDYELVGGHTWGGDVLVKVGNEYVKKGGSVKPTGTDEFGIYFVYHVEATTAEGATIGFIPVVANSFDDEKGTIDPDWGQKLTSGGTDILINISSFAAGTTYHVYVFEGSKGVGADAEKNEVAYLVADPAKVNLLVLFYDPNNGYDENLGFHSWGWIEDHNALAWAAPNKLFKDVAVIGSTPVKGAILSQTADKIDDVGLIVYAGGDDSKYTGDLKKATVPDLGIFADDVQVGSATPMFVMDAGGGNTSNENVFFGENLAGFGEEAFTLKFDLGSYADGKGTFAKKDDDGNSIVHTKFNLNIVTNFATGGFTDTEKEAIRNAIKERFSVVEVVDGEETANKVPVTKVGFDESKDKASEFILTLGSQLDHKKNYRIVYKSPHPLQERTIRFEVTAPEGTPAVYVVGSINGWKPGRSNWKLQKGTDGVWRLEVKATLLQQSFEYKYVYGPDWPYEEDVKGNRKLEIGELNTIVLQDLVKWKTEPVAGAEYPAEAEAFTLANDTAGEDLVVPEAIFAELDLDREAPEIIFQTTFTIFEGNIGVIEIERYSKWDPQMFPVFRADDNRDGNITHRVYVPGSPNEFRTLDTNELGDYKILLRVEDDWGHVTEVVFIFRVVKKIGK